MRDRDGKFPSLFHTALQAAAPLPPRPEPTTDPPMKGSPALNWNVILGAGSPVSTSSFNSR